MKNFHLLFLILIKVIFTECLLSQNVINLAFTGNINGQHQPLDSILVENMTKGGDTVLYYPDTVLALDHSTAIPDPYNNRNGNLVLDLYPSFPNPFTCQTTIRIFLPQRDQVTIRVFDLLGKELTDYQQILPEGEHTFTLYPGNERYYILVVETSSHKLSERLISLADGGVLKVENSGYHGLSSGFRSIKLSFPWESGDQLMFIGYATLTGNIAANDTIYDSPMTSSSYTFQFTGSSAPNYPAGYVHCDPSNPTFVVDVINPITGKVWMDRNLGATQVATGPTDTNAYGDLYQWGRFADGHQCRNSNTTSTVSSSNQPSHGDFILAPSFPIDWRDPQNQNLWQGVGGINNPCPIGYRLPTEAELDAELASWSSSNSAGAYASPLKLPMSGYRDFGTGQLSDLGLSGGYWSSSDDGGFSKFLGFRDGFASLSGIGRATGYSVRCIKEN